MPFTYDPTILDATVAGLRNQVRLKLGDNDPHVPLLDDKEVDYFVAQSSSDVPRATVAAGKAVMARIARRPETETNGTITINWGDVRARIQGVLDTILPGSSVPIVPGFAGGTSIADIETRDHDTDKPPWTYDETGPGDASPHPHPWPSDDH